MADRAYLNPSDGGDGGDPASVGPSWFPRVRKALCRTLDAGRHWPARNAIAACGTWRELKALFGRDLPTHDAGILRVRLAPDGSSITIVAIDPFDRVRGGAANGRPIAQLTEGVDY